MRLLRRNLQFLLKMMLPVILSEGSQNISHTELDSGSVNKTLKHGGQSDVQHDALCHCEDERKRGNRKVVGYE